MNRWNLTLFSGLMLLAFPARGDVWSWKTYSSAAEVTAINRDQQLLWIGSHGGLLAYNPSLETFKLWTNTEGLASNSVTAITVDPQERIWIGFDTGAIQRFDPENGTWERIDDYLEHPVSCLTLNGDSLFVGLDIGISLYRISRKEVKETYRHLGAGLQVDLPVLRVLIENDTIWAVTSHGLAHAGLETSNLLDPENWNAITELDGTDATQITDIAPYDQTIYVSASSGVFRKEGEEWQRISQIETIDLEIHENLLLGARVNGVYAWDGQSWTAWSAEIQGITNIFSAFSKLWGGTEQGILEYETELSTWTRHVPNSPGSNLISHLTVDETGRLWAASRNNGVSLYTGTEWILYNVETFPDMWTNDVVAVNADLTGNTWLGTWGKGAIFLRPDGSFEAYRSINGYLSGISVDPDYVVVSHILTDSRGTTWLINREAVNNLPVVAVSHDSLWTYYGTGEGITSKYLQHITEDSEGRKWFGSEMHGLYILDDAGTSDYKGDDPAVIHLTTADGLESNEITALAVEKDGGVWIGTPKGLHYYFFGNISRRYGLASDNITALLIDGANNLWVGTHVGLSHLSAADFSWTHYTSENSGLVSNDITTLALDSETGILYIGTNQGISSLNTPYSRPLTELADLSIYPNPYLPAEHGNVTIDNLSENVTVVIFTSGGYQVRVFNPDQVYGRSIRWDGRDSSGNPVASGIYLVVSKTEDGQTRADKLALIR
jgi:streptogramin lyase